MKNISNLSNYRIRILLSLLVSVLVVVVVFIPEQAIESSRNYTTNKESGFNRIESENFVTDYGSLKIEKTDNQSGYGYIRHSDEEIVTYGILTENIAADDSIFNSRLHIFFPEISPLAFTTAGINYALLNNRSLYIENKGVSTVRGFTDVIDLGLIISPDAVIDSVIYLGSRETPSYVDKLMNAGFIEKFSGLKLTSDHTIDAVAGATITCIAIAESVDEIIRLSNHEFLNDHIDHQTGNFSVMAKLSKLWIINLIVLLLLFSVFGFRLVKNRIVLLILSILSITWIGFYLNSSFTYLLFIKSFSGISLSVFTISYILLVIVSAIWMNNAYCKHVCPFGNTQRLIFKYSLLKKYQVSINNKHLKYFRYLVTIAVLVMYFAGFELITQYEMFPHLFGINPNSLFFWISLSIVLISLIIPNFWCRTLCPTGCVLDVVSDIARTDRST